MEYKWNTNGIQMEYKWNTSALLFPSFSPPFPLLFPSFFLPSSFLLPSFFLPKTNLIANGIYFNSGRSKSRRVNSCSMTLFSKQIHAEIFLCARRTRVWKIKFIQKCEKRERKREERKDGKKRKKRHTRNDAAFEPSLKNCKKKSAGKFHFRISFELVSMGRKPSRAK